MKKIIISALFFILYVVISSIIYHNQYPQHLSIDITISCLLGLMATCIFYKCLELISTTKYYKKWTCSHGRQKFVENIYGDEINTANARSIWKCEDCGQLIFKNKLHELIEKIDRHFESQVKSQRSNNLDFELHSAPFRDNIHVTTWESNINKFRVTKGKHDIMVYDFKRHQQFSIPYDEIRDLTMLLLESYVLFEKNYEGKNWDIHITVKERK